MNKKVNILFLGGSKRVSLAEHLIESGKLENIDVEIFSYELSDIVPIISTATVIIGKKWNENDVISDILENCVKFNINCILPFVDPATTIAAKIKLLKPEITVPVSTSEICDIFFSKIKTQIWCESNQIPIPKTTKSNFPLIAKPEFGSASKGIQIINNNDELIAFETGTESNNYLIQEFINGQEYTVDAYISCFNGKIQYLVPRLRIETQGGESIISKTLKDELLDGLCRDVIYKSGLKGAVTLQWIKEKGTNKFYFMEINPRFAGAVVTSIGAGINIGKCIFADIFNTSLEEQTNWLNELIMIRRFSEIYIHANNN